MSRPPRTKSWSLAQRVTWWTLGCIALPATATLAASYGFLRISVMRELHALAAEEAEEAHVHLRNSNNPRAAFADVAAELSADHPDTPFAWRVYDVTTRTQLGEHGASSLLARDTPPDSPWRSGRDIGRHLGGGQILSTFDTPGNMRVVMMIDGSKPYALLNSYGWAAASMLLVGTLLAFSASRLAARRLAGMVRSVADEVGTARRNGTAVVTQASAPEEIRHLTDSLREEMRIIGAEADRVRLFTAGLAHELRSPLQNLVGQTEVALLGDRRSEDYRTVLTRQHHELSELSDAVDNLLAMCAPRPSAPTDASEEFDLLTEVRLRLRREDARASREGVTLTLHGEGDTTMVGDREAMLRGIRNVVANALDWTPPGGHVSTAIVAEDERIRVTIDDTGPGVPVEDRSRIFEIFVRGKSRRGHRVGYGLGLAMARAAVSAHGGTIEVGDAPSGGARFVLTVARRPAPTSPASHWPV